MAIYYSPNPSSTPSTSLKQYSTATNDIVVSGASAVVKLTKTLGLVWSAYSPSAADKGATIPYIPGTASGQAPVVPSLVATVLVSSQTITSGQAANFTPVSIYGGSAVATSYLTSGTFVGYNISVSPSLPAGLALTSTFTTVNQLNVTNATYYLYNSASVKISGTPTSASPSQTYTINFSDASGLTANASFTLAVLSNQNPLTVTGLLTTNQLLTQGVAVPNLATVSSQGGSGTLNYSISPTLPAGLSFSTATGVISGTPTSSASVVTYTVTVTDQSSPAQTASATFNLLVNANPPVATLAVPNRSLTQGVSFTAFTPVTGSGGTAPLRYTISPSLPNGLTFTTSTGAISGIPSAPLAATNFSIAVVDSLNNSANQTFNLTIVSLPLLSALQTQPSYNLYRSTPVTAFTPVRANGGFGTVSYAIAPALPSGLSYASSDGSVTGTPTTTSTTATYTVSISDQGGQTATATFALSVASIPISVVTAVPSTLLTRNVAFNTFIPVTASGGYTPYSYAITPALPSGLAFSTSSGYISGTPTVSNPATSYSETVTDSAQQAGSASFSITVVSPTAIS